MTTDIIGAELNTGEENRTRVTNMTGSTILNGTVVYLNGAAGNRPTVSPASYTDHDSADKTIGVATVDIAHGADGYVCTEGVVRGYDTSDFTDGDRLYLSTAGGLTNVAPSYGVVAVAYALNSTNSATGKILVSVQRGITVDGAIPYTGFDYPDNVISVYSIANQTITLSTATNAVFYYRGVAIFDLSLGAHVSSARTAGNGTWFYYYNGSNFVWSLTPWTFDKGQLGVVYKSATAEFGICEPHGDMPGTTHRRLHEEIGTSRISGGVASGVVAGTGSVVEAERRPSFTAATLRDEDVTTVIDAQAAGGYTKFSIGALNATVFSSVVTDFVELAGTVPRWNSPLTGAFTTLTSNQYMNVWVVDVPTMSDTGSKVYRRWFINGQLASTDKTKIDSQTISSLNLGDIVTSAQEFVFTYRYLIRANAAANNWSVVSENRLEGNQRTQISSASNTVALANVVSGGLGLIPVGTTASGHTVFDGSVGPRLEFTAGTGLKVSCNQQEALTLEWPSGVVGQQSKMCYELRSVDGITPICYAETLGEVASNTAGLETGAFKIRTRVAGTMTDHIRVADGKVGIMKTAGTYPLEVAGTIATNPTTGSEQFVAATNTTTSLAALVCVNDDSDTLTVGQYGSTRVGAIFGQNNANRAVMFTLGTDIIIGAGSVGSASIYFGTNNTLALTIGTDQSATFAGQVFLRSATAALGSSFRMPLGTEPTTKVAGDVWMTSTGINYVTTDGGATRQCATLTQNAFSGNQDLGTGEIKIRALRGLYLAGAGAPTTAGDFAHDTTQKAFVNFANGLKGWMPREIYKMYNGYTSTNPLTGSRANLFSGTTPLGSNTIANFSVAGKTYIVKCGGKIIRGVSSTVSIEGTRASSSFLGSYTIPAGTSTLEWIYISTIVVTGTNSVSVSSELITQVEGTYTTTAMISSWPSSATDSTASSALEPFNANNVTPLADGNDGRVRTKPCRVNTHNNRGAIVFKAGAFHCFIHYRG
jgi:predicted RecA/RadA family phage recombinase